MPLYCGPHLFVYGRRAQAVRSCPCSSAALGQGLHQLERPGLAHSGILGQDQASQALGASASLSALTQMSPSTMCLGKWGNLGLWRACLQAGVYCLQTQDPFSSDICGGIPLQVISLLRPASAEKGTLMGRFPLCLCSPFPVLLSETHADPVHIPGCSMGCKCLWDFPSPQFQLMWRNPL